MPLLAPGELGFMGYPAGTVLGEWPIDLGGLALDRVDEYGGLWNVTAFTGRGSAPSAIETGQRTAGHGSWIGGRWWAAKPYTVDIAYEGETPADRWAAEQRLLAAVSLQDTVMVMHEEVDRQATVVLNGEVTIDPVNVYAFTAQVPLLAVDPFRYAVVPDLVASTGLPSQSGGLSWDAVPVDELRNLITNPSFEIDLTGWAARGANVTMSRDTTTSYAGSASVKGVVGTTALTADQGIAADDSGSRIPVTPGTTYALQARMKSTAGVDLDLAVLWRDSGGVLLTAPLLATVTATGAWDLVSGTITAPANAATLGVLLRTDSTSVTYHGDAVMVEEAVSVSAYGDGDSPGWEWDGTPHASTSRRPAGFTGGASWPATWDAVVESGVLSVFNAGTADAYPIFRAYGPLPDFTLAQPDTGEILVVDLSADGESLAQGEWIEVDMRRQRITLLGQSSRRRALRGDFFGLPPGQSEIRFGSSAQNTTAFVEIEGHSTWI